MGIGSTDASTAKQWDYDIIECIVCHKLMPYEEWVLNHQREIEENKVLFSTSIYYFCSTKCKEIWLLKR